MERPLTYARIPLETRKDLVDSVLTQKQSICKAAKKLKIKNSTAKLIVKRFRDTKTYFEPKKDKVQREQKLKTETDSFNDLPVSADAFSPNENATPNFSELGANNLYVLDQQTAGWSYTGNYVYNMFPTASHCDFFTPNYYLYQI